jgi:hypothetical protein
MLLNEVVLHIDNTHKNAIAIKNNELTTITTLLLNAATLFSTLSTLPVSNIAPDISECKAIKPSIIINIFFIMPPFLPGYK